MLGMQLTFFPLRVLQDNIVKLQIHAKNTYIMLKYNSCFFGMLWNFDAFSRNFA